MKRARKSEANDKAKEQARLDAEFLRLLRKSTPAMRCEIAAVLRFLAWQQRRGRGRSVQS